MLGINYWIEVRLEREEEHLGRQMEANTQSGSLKHYLRTLKKRPFWGNFCEQVTSVSSGAFCGGLANDFSVIFTPGRVLIMI